MESKCFECKFWGIDEISLDDNPYSTCYNKDCPMHWKIDPQEDKRTKKCKFFKEDEV